MIQTLRAFNPRSAAPKAAHTVYVGARAVAAAVGPSLLPLLLSLPTHGARR